MSGWQPRTGAIVDRLLRRDPLDAAEQALADWASDRGLAVVFGRCYPLEDDEQPFEPFNTYDLGLEGMIDGRLCVEMLSMTRSVIDGGPSEIWELNEQMLRANFARRHGAAA